MEKRVRRGWWLRVRSSKLIRLVDPAGTLVATLGFVLTQPIRP